VIENSVILCVNWKAANPSTDLCTCLYKYKSKFKKLRFQKDIRIANFELSHCERDVQVGSPHNFLKIVVSNVHIVFIDYSFYFIPF
jgi:hypothetical protein